MTIIALGDDLGHFGDTAALLENLDLLISVDTSVVHLAGRRPGPVWMLVGAGRTGADAGPRRIRRGIRR